MTMVKMIKKLQHRPQINNTTIQTSFTTSLTKIPQDKDSVTSIKSIFLKKTNHHYPSPLYLPKSSNALQYSYMITESPRNTHTLSNYTKLPKISASSNKKMKYKLLNNSSLSLSYQSNSKNLSTIHKVYNVPSPRMKHPYEETIDRKIISSGRSSAGMKVNNRRKVNQDSFMIINNSTNINPVFGIFDGHGKHGHFVSQFLKGYIVKYFESLSSTSRNSNIMQEAVIQTYKSCEEQLKHVKFDTNDSGSTAIILIQLRDKILCFNTGDSRGIYINDSNEVFAITNDHKPNEPGEEKRITRAGGKIEKDGYGDQGTYRIYDGDNNGPGLALSRSFGDFNAKSLGIISTPDVYELSITNDHIKVIVLGSDGLWDSMPIERVRDLIEPFIENKKAIEASNVLLSEAKKGWARQGVYCDDITVIVLFL